MSANARKCGRHGNYFSDAVARTRKKEGAVRGRDLGQDRLEIATLSREAGRARFLDSWASRKRARPPDPPGTSSSTLSLFHGRADGSARAWTLHRAPGAAADAWIHTDFEKGVYPRETIGI